MSRWEVGNWHFSLCEDPRLDTMTKENERKKSWLSSSLWTQWPETPSACCSVFPTMMEYNLELWTRIISFIFRLILLECFITVTKTWGYLKAQKRICCVMQYMRKFENSSEFEASIGSFWALLLCKSWNDTLPIILVVVYKIVLTWICFWISRLTNKMPDLRLSEGRKNPVWFSWNMQ